MAAQRAIGRVHGFLHTPTSDTLNVLPAGRAGWVEGTERAREAACVVRRAWCVVRGRSLCRRAEEQLTVICVGDGGSDEGWVDLEPNLQFTIAVASSAGHLVQVFEHCDREVSPADGDGRQCRCGGSGCGEILYPRSQSGDPVAFYSFTEYGFLLSCDSRPCFPTPSPALFFISGI